MRGEGRRPLNIEAGSGEYHYQRMLDELAVADVKGIVPYGYVLNQLALDCSSGETVVVFITTHDRENDQVLDSLAALHMRGVHLLVVVLESSSFSEKARATPAHAERVFTELSALGASCFLVKCGDDLERLFNT
jgi:hypothetical protein